MNNFSWKCLAVALAFVTVGCGTPGPTLYKAGGTVTYKDKPVEGATLTFTYDDGNFASGATDAAGKFQLSYLGRPGGAVPGKCKVTVSKKESALPAAASAASADPNAKPKTQEEYMAKNKALTGMKAVEKATPKDLIPAKYADVATSGLTYEIKTNEKENDFSIVLKD